MSQPLLGVVFTAWFGFDPDTGDMIGGLGSTHWNDGPNTGGIVHRPWAIEGAIGPAPGNPDPGPEFYCSADPVVVSKQMEWMEQAGVSFLLFSWWGWGDTDLDGVVEGHPDQWVDKTLEEWLKQLKQKGSHIKLAVLIEPFPYTQAGIDPWTLSNLQLQRVLDYLYKNYYEKYPDQFLAWRGYPLVGPYDNMVMVDAGMVDPTVTGSVAQNNAIGWRPKTDVATIELINPGPGGVLDVQVAQNINVQVTLATDGGGNIISTANDVIAAVNGDAEAEAVLGAEGVTGSDGTGTVAAVPQTDLTAITTLASDALAGATEIVVDNEDLFSVGDHIQVTGLVEGGLKDVETATIAALDGGAGPTYTIQLVEPLRYGHTGGQLAKKSDFRWTHRWVSSAERTPQKESAGWQWWLVPQQALSVTISDDGVVFPNHRFTEYYLHLWQASYLTYQWRNIDPMLEEGVYEQQWQWMVDNRDQIELIIVYSWNFYGELAQLEPSTLGPAPPEDEYLEKTRRYYQALLAGADIEVYSRAWMKPKELREMVQPINWDELGFESDDELDLFLKNLLRRAQDHVESYLGRTYASGIVPPAVKEVALRLGANMYNYLLKVRRGPLMQVGEFEVRQVDDSVFTSALRRDLRPFRTGRVLGAIR